jgi:hypothetical protein
MDESMNITQASEELRPLLEHLIKPESSEDWLMVDEALITFLESGSDERILAFCVESWKAGRAIFNAVEEIGINDVANFPGDMLSGICIISVFWQSEFKKHPKQAREGLLYAETQLWQKGDSVADWWGGWLRRELNYS